MPSDKTERLLLEIGQALAKGEEDASAPTLLYALLDDNFVAPSIFKDMGEHILYRSPDLDLFGDLLLDLWDDQEPRGRWAEIEYLTHDGRFEVIYTYPEEVDPEEEEIERRNRIVRRHFGDKPIIYPPWRQDDDGAEFFEL